MRLSRLTSSSICLALSFSLTHCGDGQSDCEDGSCVSMNALSNPSASQGPSVAPGPVGSQETPVYDVEPGAPNNPPVGGPVSPASPNPNDPVNPGPSGPPPTPDSSVSIPVGPLTPPTPPSPTEPGPNEPEPQPEPEPEPGPNEPEPQPEPEPEPGPNEPEPQPEPEPEPDIDANGKTNASPGDETSTSRDYLRLGDLRLLNNKWGSDERGCDTSLRVFVNLDRTLGWDFNRGACGGGGGQPDYPEIEFGIHPFGIGTANETSPPFSSTTLLPLQIKDITSGSVQIDNLNISLGSGQAWNINFEMWLSERHPVESADPGVYAEVIAFWGWQDGRWPCDTSGSVQAGSRSYSLCHQVDDWADGQWRYFQFRVDGGPSTNFSGTLDAKAFLDWLVNTRGYSPDLWVTRLEIGSEIDDNTNGTVTLNNITFEINGTSKSVELLE